MIGPASTAPMPWKKALVGRLADALHSKAMSADTVAAKLMALGQRFEDQGDMKSAADCYSKAAAASRLSGDEDRVSEGESWTTFLTRTEEED